MEAGRDLDRLIAKKVMHSEPNRVAIATSDGGESAAVVQNQFDGPFFTEENVKEWINKSQGYSLGYWYYYPPYSTDISEAWRVVEQVRGSDGRNLLQLVSPEEGDYNSETNKHRGWFASFSKKWWRDDTPYEWTEGATAPHAICLAALKFMES